MPGNKSSYVPPQIQREMAQQLQRTLPPQLKEYASGQVYIPKHAEKALMQHMDKTMPPHLKEYAGQFIQQQSLSGQMNFRNSVTQKAKPVVAPVANPMRRDHSLGFGQQYTVDLDNSSPLSHSSSISFTPQFQGATQDPAATTQPSVVTFNDQPPPADYNFILNPPGHKRNGLFSPDAPMSQRILMVVAGTAILGILGMLFLSLMSHSGSNTTALLAVAQKQTELKRITDTSYATPTTQPVEDLATQVNLSIISDSQAATRYLKRQGVTFDQKQLTAGRNTATDKELSDAKTNGDYDQTFVSLLTAQLTSYEGSLQQAALSAQTANGRQLYTAEYGHAKLLLQEAQQIH